MVILWRFKIFLSILLMGFLFSPVSGQHLLTIQELWSEGHGNAHSISWSPQNPDRIAVLGGLGIGIYNASFQEITYQPISLYGETILYSPDGNYLAVASKLENRATAQIYQAETLQVIHTLSTGHITSEIVLAWSPDSSKLALARQAQDGVNSVIEIWNAIDGKLLKILESQPGFIFTLAWDSNTLIAGGERGVFVWNVEENTSTPFDHTFGVYGMALSPDKTLLALPVGPNIEIWNIQPKQKVATLSGHSELITFVAWGANAIASASHDGTIRIWNTSNWQQINMLRTTPVMVTQLVWCAEGFKLAVLDTDSVINLWDGVSAEWVAMLTDYTGEQVDVSWSPTNTFLATVGENGRLIIWDAATGKVTNNVLIQKAALLNSVSWSGDNRIAISGIGGGISIWDAHTANLTSAFKHHLGPVTVVAWNPDNHFLASGGAAGRVTLFDSKTSEIIETTTPDQSGVKAVEWSPNGELIAIGTYAGNVYLWDIGTQQVVPIVNLPDFIQALSWNNSGTQIAITNLWDQVIWDTILHQKVISLQKVTDSIHSLTWYPNGDYIIGASQQGNLVIWNAKDGKVLQQYSVGNSVIMSVAWNKAGTMLAVTLADGTTKLFETNI